MNTNDGFTAEGIAPLKTIKIPSRATFVRRDERRKDSCVGHSNGQCKMNEMKERMRTEKSYFSKRSIIFIGIS